MGVVVSGPDESWGFGGGAENRFHPYLSFIERGGRDVNGGANRLLFAPP